MSEMFLNLSHVPQTKRQDVKIGENRYLNVPQGTTTQEFTEYLKKYEPDVFIAIEEMDKKLNQMPTPKDNEEMLLGTPAKIMKAVNPKILKNGWQKLEAFILNKTKKPPRVTIDELNERYEKGKEILNDIRNNEKELI